jgi:hypothetical protein
MTVDDTHADRLNDAIDGLISGRDPDAVAGDLPDDLRPLVAAGDRLLRARRPAGTALRPGFVLALEDQLRTDLRLGRVRPARIGRVSVIARAAFVVLLGVTFLGLVAQRARPTDRLYGLRRAIEHAQVVFASGPAARSAREIDLGWRRLRDVETVIDAAPDDTARVRRVLGDLVSAFTNALEAADASADPHAVARARAEAAAAADALARAGAEAATSSPGNARLLALSVAALGTLAAREAPHYVSVAVDPRAQATPTAPAAVATAVDAPATGAPPPASQPTALAGAATRPAPAGVTPTPTVATPVAPTGAPTVIPTEVTHPRAPEATLVTPRPSATGTSHVDPVSPTPAAPPTRTPDRWPATTTPPPASPVVPTVVTPSDPPVPGPGSSPPPPSP